MCSVKMQAAFQHLFDLFLKFLYNLQIYLSGTEKSGQNDRFLSLFIDDSTAGIV